MPQMNHPRDKSRQMKAMGHRNKSSEQGQNSYPLANPISKTISRKKTSGLISINKGQSNRATC